MGETPASELRPDLRGELERIAEALGLAVGETELVLRFDNGHLRWWTPSRIRVPASELEATRRTSR